MGEAHFGVPPASASTLSSTPADLRVNGVVLTARGEDRSGFGVRNGVIVDASGHLGGGPSLTGFVLPGLVDVHCHIGLGPTGAVDPQTAVTQAEADRDAGTLLVRDAGSPLDTSWVHQRRDLPRLIRAGRHIARPKRYLRYYARELDDVRQLPGAVREEARRGDGWVKLVGDWIDRSMGPEADLRPLWPDDVLAQAVAVAHEEGARVTVHTFAAQTIPQLLAAGVDHIEHGTGITPELMPEIAERGIPVTATLMQVSQFEQIAAQADGKYPVFAARMRDLHARRYEQVRALHEAGVLVLAGTDAGGTIGHGRIAEECAQMVRAGIPAADVIANATWRAREFLGASCLEPGASADFVVYDEDPREDITVLARPRAVVLRGEVFSPLHLE